MRHYWLLQVNDGQTCAIGDLASANPGEMAKLGLWPRPMGTSLCLGTRAVSFGALSDEGRAYKGPLTLGPRLHWRVLFVQTEGR